jgi:hypothetical protein
MSNFDRSKSLQELEGADGGAPDGESYVVTNAHRLHHVPLQDYTVDDLRFMIGQQIGLQYLIPIALEQLREDPWAAGDHYPGDLLASVLHADSRFWIASPQWRAEADEVVCRAISLLPSLDEADQATARESFTRAYDIFQRAEYFAQHGRS